VSEAGFTWVERDVTRRGKTHKQWFRVKDKSAAPAAKKPRAAKAAASEKAAVAEKPLKSREEVNEVLKAVGINCRDYADPIDVMKSTFGRALTKGELFDLLGLPALQKVGPVSGNVTFMGERGVVMNTSLKVRIESEWTDPVKIAREFYKLDDGSIDVHHESFHIAKHLQGKGTGREVLQSQMRMYDKLGVRNIALSAAEVGRYYWPKIGFDRPTAAGQIEGDKRAFEQYLKTEKRLSPEAASKIVGNLRTLHDIVTTQIGEDRVGKSWALDWSAGGSMQLRVGKGEGWETAKRELAL
jgi:hypothetical protein